MGHFDKLTGTKRPDDGVVPDPAEEVRGLPCSASTGRMFSTSSATTTPF